MQSDLATAILCAIELDSPRMLEYVIPYLAGSSQVHMTEVSSARLDQEMAVIKRLVKIKSFI